MVGDCKPLQFLRPLQYLTGDNNDGKIVRHIFLQHVLSDIHIVLESIAKKIPEGKLAVIANNTRNSGLNTLAKMLERQKC